MNMHAQIKPGFPRVAVATIITLMLVNAPVMMAQGATPQRLQAQAFNANPPTSPVRLIFVHHSTGEAWLDDGHGGLGVALRDNNYFVSDTNYGWMVNGDDIGGRTDIGNWWEWFAGPTRNAITAALYAESGQNCSYSRLDQAPTGANQIVMFKSCFPNSEMGGNPSDPAVTGDNPLRGESAGSEYHDVAHAKGIYNDILAYFTTRQDRLFVVIAAPPLRSGDTNASAAANARAFNNWLVNDWLADYPFQNVAVFDFFNVLTSNGGNSNTNDLNRTTGNHHRFRNGAIEHLTNQGGNVLAYPTGDSHPNAAGDRKASGEYLPLLNIYYNCWKGTGGCPRQPTQCALSCNATVPGNALVGQSVNFQGQATATNCSSATTYSWTFGDGSAKANAQSITHTYQSAGTYSWVFRATAGSGASAGNCTASGEITISTSSQNPRGVRRRFTRGSAATPGRLQPSDLTYLGAFRLPDRAEGADEQATWEYGGEGLAYRGAGDPGKSSSLFPGSLIGTGLDQTNRVAEIGIPVPVVSTSKNIEDLNVAPTLQPFADVRGGLFSAFTEVPRAALCVLTDTQTGEKLHIAWGQHFQEDQSARIPSHAWCNLTLSNPQTRGAWWIDDASLYSVNGYIFEVPDAWATANAGGRRLATGRYRDGGWSGMGPSLFAYAPWLSGNPPTAGTRLNVVPLLLYSNTRGEDGTNFRMNGYQHGDEWEGGAWITTTSGKSAVVFAGTKGTGQYYWYGWTDASGSGLPCVEMDPGGEPMCFKADGSACPSELVRECANHVSYRGWWSSSSAARLIFYDPEDLAKVAAGTLKPYEPQPYAYLDLDNRLFLPDPSVEAEMLGRGVQRRYRLGECAYDRARGHLFILEKFADGAKPIIHVWKAPV